MEAFQGYESRVQYDIVGHSGETHCIEFVDAKSPPVDAKQRMETLKMMHAHSQFCWSVSNELTMNYLRQNMLLNYYDSNETLLFTK